jgi:hypothetical protein
MQLYKNNAYLWLNWIILFHCLMVLLSMLGMALIIEKTSRALAVLGLLMFALFVFSNGKEHSVISGTSMVSAGNI